MALKDGSDRAVDVARREAAEWIARMTGPDAEMSRLDFERWRSRSPLNRRLYGEMQQISALSRRLGETPLGQKYLEKRRAPAWFAWPGPRAAYAGAAATVLAGGIVFLVGQYRTSPPSAQNPATSPFATRVGEIHSIRLADGTAVTLDTDSAIDTAFTGSSRIVYLTRGRARFDVVHDAARPFMVEAGGRTIVDRGTLFDVTLAREGVKVVLLRGAVEIRAGGPRGGGAPVARLAPGQVFADAAAGDQAQVSAAPKGSEQWVGGMLSYDGAPLETVVEDANRYSPHKIRLGDPGLGKLRVTGAFHATPTAALADILAATFGLRVERTGQGDFILRSR